MRPATWDCSARKLSRTAHDLRGAAADHSGMSEPSLHRVEDDLSETWLEEWAATGVAELEAYLAKHAAFRRFLESREAA